jgi:hypothetical protein
MFQQVMGPVARLALWKILLGGRVFEPRYATIMLLNIKERRAMNGVPYVGHSVTFVTVNGVWGSVAYI